MSSHHGGHYQEEEEQPAIDWRTKPIIKPDFAAGSKPKPKNEYECVFMSPFLVSVSCVSFFSFVCIDRCISFEPRAFVLFFLDLDLNLFFNSRPLLYTHRPPLPLSFRRYNIISGGDVAHAGQKSPPPKPEKGNFQKGFNIISWAEKPVAYQAKK